MIRYSPSAPPVVNGLSVFEQTLYVHVMSTESAFEVMLLMGSLVSLLALQLHMRYRLALLPLLSFVREALQAFQMFSLPILEEGE